MKLTQTQLPLHLKQNLAPIYVLSSEDLFLKQDCATHIRQAAKNRGYHEYTYLSIEHHLDESTLYHKLYSQSFFGQLNLVEIDCRDHHPNKGMAAVLTEFSQKPTSHSVLIIQCGKIDAKVAKSSWYRAAEQTGVTIAIWPISREQLPAWIIERAKKYALQFEPAALNYLAEQTEGNLMATAQSLEQLSLWQPNGSISKKFLEEMLNQNTHFTVFDFVQHLISANTARALKILESLKQEGTEATLILWAICRELRLLAEIAAAKAQGHAESKLFKQHRIVYHRETAVKKFLQKHSQQDCWQLLKHAAQIDRLIKGADSGDPWDALALFCLRP